MTEYEKKEFEEFLQWKKEKQKEANLAQQRLEEQTEQQSESSNRFAKQNKKTEKAIYVLGLILIVYFISLLVSNRNSDSKESRIIRNHTETVDSLQAIRDSMQQASVDSIKKANRIKLLKNSVRITTARLSSPNSAGGVDAIVFYKNLSDKTIKYFYWEGCAKNAVGDIVENEIGGRVLFRGKDTGPIKPRKTGGGCWDCIIYNSTARKLIITEVAIEYMDGTELKILENEIKYIS